MRRLSFALIALGAIVALPCLARAEAPVPGFGAPVAEEELDATRGGFISAGGLNFQFGAVVRTFVDGVMALESTLSLNSDGLTTSQVSGPDVAALSPTDLSSAGAIELGQLGGRVVDLGGTVVAHGLTQDQLTNIVVNTADFRTITQNVALNLILPGFKDVQQSGSLAALAIKLHDDGLFSSMLGSVR